MSVAAVKLSHVAVLITGLAFNPLVLATDNGRGPDVSQIVKRSVATNAADWSALPEYSYYARYKKSKVDSSGQAATEQTRTYETLMIEGSPYERVIAIDNQPLSRWQQEQEQTKLDRETARRKSESPAQRQARIAKYESARAEEHVLMQQMVEAFTFTMAGEQRIDGIDCYVLNATPNRAYQPPMQKARVLLGMRGRLWIDKDNYHWVKVQAEVIDPVQFGVFVAKVKPGTKFELQQAPVGDVWLPKHFTETVNASVLGIYGLHTREDEEYSDYRSLRVNDKASKQVLSTIAATTLAHPSPRAQSSDLAAR
jgi:hypothetical protein